MVLTVLWPWRLARHLSVYKQKAPVLLPHPPISRVQLPGSGATLLLYPPILAHRAFRSRAVGFRACGGRTRARPHGLTLLLGFLSGLPTGFFAPICHSLEGPETSPAGAEQPGTEDAISPRSASLNAPADLLLVQTPGVVDFDQSARVGSGLNQPEHDFRLVPCQLRAAAVRT